MPAQPLAAEVLVNAAAARALSSASSSSASAAQIKPGEGGLKLSLSLPSSHAESPIPSPKPFVGGAFGATVPTPGAYSPLLAAKHPPHHSLPHTPLSTQSLHVSLSSADSSARNTPISSARSGSSAAGSSIASEPSPFAASPSAPPAVAVARAPRFPPSLRAPSCSIIGQMLAPPAPVAAAPPPAFFVAVSKPAEPPPPDVDAVAKLLASESFSLSSLIQSAGQSSGIPVFEFDAHPSPDDLTRIRLQKAGAPARGLTTDAPSLESREQKKAAATKPPKPLSKAKLAKLKEEEEMRYLMGDSSAVGGWNSSTRSAVGGALQLSTASVGAGTGASPSVSSAISASASPSSELLSLTQSISRSRLFSELFKRISAQKLGVLDELTKGAQVASWLLQQLVRAPREKERQKQQTSTVEDVSAGSSSAASSSASSSSSSSSAPSPAEEPVAVKLSLPSSSTAPVVPLAQITSLQESLLRTRLASAEAMLSLAGGSMSESVRSLYALKRSAFAAGRSMLAHAANPSAAPLELLTPTAFPSYVRPLSTLNLLVVSAPASGASTLLAQLLYLQGRLPFSLVKTRGAPPEYWETFYAPQTTAYAAEAAAAASASSSSSADAPTTSPTLTPATTAFIAAHSKMHARNARRYNFQRYRHCVYTDRYRLRLLDSLPGDDLPSSSSSAASPGSSAHLSRTVSAALSADFVLLVVDGSRVSSFITTPRMQQQLLLAYQQGVRCVVICVTRMDSAHATSAASAASIWSQHKFDSIVAAVTSSCLKPLGFTAAHTLSIPVSGRSGENIVTRTSPELSSWYTGPTLMQLLDRVTMPVARQPETLTAQRLVARIAEPPQIKYSMLNDEVVESVRLRVQVLSGAVLHAEPVALMQLDSDSDSIPLGPLHTSILEREQQQDERDLLVYEDDVLEEAGASSAGAGAAASSSTNAAGGSNSAAAASTAATAVTKHKLSADGRKLTNAERKAALAEEKKAHARQAAKLAASKNHKQDWKDEQAYWLEASEAAEKEAQQEAGAGEESQTKQDEATAAAGQSAAAAVVSPSSSLLYSSPSSFLSTTLSPCPALLCGDVGFVSVTAMPLPATNRDDALDTLLSGRNWAESIVSHSKEVLDFVAKHARVGDLLTAPLSGNGDAVAQCPKLASAFRCELVALLSWDSELHIKTGDTLQAILWQSGGGSEQQEGADPSLSAAAAAPVSVTVSRLVSVLNKANRAVLRKKPDYLSGPPSVGSAASVGTDSAPITAAPDVSVVEFACAQPLMMDTLTSGGTRLATIMIMHKQTCIAIASVTHVIT